MNIEILYIGGGLWVMIVAIFVLKKKNIVVKNITKKKIKENSPIRRENNLSDEAQQVDSFIDSGDLSVKIEWNEGQKINPKLLFDLVEDIQDVVYRKDRGGESKAKTVENKEFNNYINILTN